MSRAAETGVDSSPCWALTDAFSGTLILNRVLFISMCANSFAVYKCSIALEHCTALVEMLFSIKRCHACKQNAISSDSHTHVVPFIFVGHHPIRAGTFLSTWFHANISEFAEGFTVFDFLNCVYPNLCCRTCQTSSNLISSGETPIAMCQSPKCNANLCKGQKVRTCLYSKNIRNPNHALAFPTQWERQV